MIRRRQTRKVTIGDEAHGFVAIGGDAPVSVQTMTAGYTYENVKCVAEIHKLAAAGADLVRVAVPEKKDTAALKEIIPQVSVPIVADVHFHFQRAMEAIEAGVHKIRLNPGNINDRAQVKDVIQACKAKKLPIRIGVNEGSIVERKDKQRRMKELGGVFSENKNGHFLAIMIAKLEEYLEIFQEENFHDIVISAKSIDPLLVIDAYKAISERFDYPLHLGVTHAGPKETGTIRSVVPLGHLLASGIGDTVRISYANDPIYEVQGEKVANVPEDNILDALLDECRKFQAKVVRGETKLGEKKVDILPPDPIGDLGSGWEKIQKEKGLALPV